eukprot:gene7639-589_t
MSGKILTTFGKASMVTMRPTTTFSFNLPQIDYHVRYSGSTAVLFHVDNLRVDALMVQQKTQNSPAKMAALSKEIQETQHMELDSLGMVVDPWVPIPREHRASLFSLEGLKQRWEHIKKRVRATLSVGVVRRYDKTWKPVQFAETVQNNLIQVQEALSEASREFKPLHLHDYITAQALTSMKQQSRIPHIWEFVDAVERPRVVHVTAFPIDKKDNYYGQVTVRVHLRQRFAPVGQAPEERDIVDYVVLEKRIVAPQTPWRICSKILPLFLMPKDEQKRLQAEQHRKLKEKERAPRYQTKEYLTRDTVSCKQGLDMQSSCEIVVPLESRCKESCWFDLNKQVDSVLESVLCGSALFNQQGYRAFSSNSF